MTEVLLIAVSLLSLLTVVLVSWLLRRGLQQEAIRHIRTQLDVLKENAERLDRSVRDEIARNREESSAGSRSIREELNRSLTLLADSSRSQLTDVAKLQKQQLDTFSDQLSVLTQSNEQRLEKMRETVESKLSALQEDNSKKLEQMRATVDEKLHSTLERRLGESFQLVSERLEQVQKGLGEMQTLASGVGDLKKVLTNVKTRGTWGEIQLGNLLEQILTPEQYACNVVTRSGSNDRVEFAIKLPGQDAAGGGVVWLPIDAKFPQEDYQRLMEAQEQANPALVEETGKQLELRVKGEARSIREKYLDPPRTTDFGIMFLPIEGLYAEVLRRPGLVEFLQREYRVVLTGPTTLGALLNSLQMGFRTLAIEKRSSEVWALLSAIKTEFGKFGEVLKKTQDKLREASNSIETAATRTRMIERKLRDVEQLPAKEASHLLGPVPDRDDEL